MATDRSYEAQIIVIEGLDGVGKSTVAQDLVHLTKGVNVSEVVARSIASVHELGMLKQYSPDVRYRYWLWVNYMAGECARSVVSSGRVAVIDGYVFRTFATHSMLGVQIEVMPILTTVTRPDRAVLLTVDEDTRLERIQSREAGPESAWHARLRVGRSDVLAAYQKFGLMEIDTLRPPMEVAEQIMHVEVARNFWFG